MPCIPCRLILVLLALLPVAITMAEENGDPPLTRVSLQLQWKHQFEFAGYYAAIEQGFYRDQGLEVELREYHPGLDVLDAVRSGEATFALTHGQVIAWRLQGEPVVLLANYFRKPPFVLLTRAGLHSLAALRGGRLMAAPDDLQSPLLRAALRNAGLIPGENLTIIPHSFDASPLIRGEIDAMTAFVTNDPYDLESKGVGFQILELGGYLPGLGDGYLFTSEAQARDQPEVTRAFVEASNAGWRYVLAHTDEMIDLIHTRYAPQRSRAALRYEATRTRELMQTPLLPVGAVAPARIELAAAAMLETGTLGEARHLDDFVFQAPAALARPAADPEWTDAERAWLAEHDQIVLGISTQFEPAVIVAEDGTISGTFVDYVALLNEQLGGRVKLHIESDWESIAQKAITREIDGLAITAPNPIWEEHFRYTVPYFYAYLYVFQRSDQPPMRLPADLAGQRIGYLRGFKKVERHLAAVPTAELIPFDTQTQMVDALLANQVAALVASDELEWQRQERSERQFRVTGILEGSRSPIVVSIRNDWPLAVSVINKALSSIPADKHASIRRRWLLGTALNDAVTLTPQQRDWLQQHPVLRYTLWNDRAPVEYVDGAGRPSGISSEYLAAVAHTLGLHLEFVPTSNWPEALERLRAGEIDLLPSAAPSAVRSDALAFTDTYLELPVAIFAPLEAPFYGSLEALSGQRVAVIGGTVTEDWLRRDHPQLDVLAFPNAESGIHALERGEVVALVDTLLTFSHVIGRDGPPRLRVAGTTPYRLNLAMAARRELAPLAEMLNQALAAIPPAERDAIEQRWMQAPRLTPIDYRLLWQVLSGAAFIIAIILYWNWRLSRTQAALARSETYYRTLIATMADGLLVHDRDGLIRTCNAAAARLLGQREAALIGQVPGWQLRREDGTPLPMEQQPALVTLRTGVAQRNLLLELTDAYGGPRWIALNTAPLVLERDADPDAVLVTFTDVTERVRAEQSLRESQARYDDIVRLIPVGIYTLSQQRGAPEALEYLSPRGQQMLGLPNDGTGPPPSIEDLFALVEPEDRERLVLANQVNTKENFFWEGRIHVHGGIRWYRLESVAAPQSNTFCIWQGVITDITAQKEAEAALIQARQEAEAANRAKSDFLANMSHEIRTPMNSVLGMMHLCLETELTATQRDYLDQAQRAARALLGLLNDILDLSKVEAGHIRLEDIPFALSSVLADLNALIAGQTEDKGLAWRIERDPAIPDALRGDPLRLGQVLINLTSNAIKFTERGEVAISVRLERLEREQVRLAFTVQDTGIGMSEDQIAGLFRPFHQADTSITRRYGGTGLGLSISQRLAALMQGDIRVSSQLGQGSTFTLSVALGLAPATWQQPLVAPPAARDRLGGRHILLVEDNGVNRAVARGLLERAGAQVDEAEHGLAALERIQNQGLGAWDLILMDIQMPELDGLETTRRIRALPDGAAIPILGLSASSRPQDVTATQAAGMNAHLSKPIDPPTLFAEFARWLGTSHTQSTAVLGADADPSAPPEPDSAPALRFSPPDQATLAAAQPILERLIALTQAFDAEAEDYFQAHRDQLAPVLGPEDCASLARHIARYRFPEASALLKKLRPQQSE